MGLLSFGFGICFGFYLRNTRIGDNIRNKLFVVQKLLKNHNISQYKLTLVVRDDLNMGKGKIASQCSHASVLAYKNIKLLNPEVAEIWEAFGQTKIVLKTSSSKSLLELATNAENEGLLTNIVCDAGRTEVVAGTKTVLAVGPGPKHVVDKVTGHLKLL
ncbi:peptidyl-tRNA hydrolase 2, mitochondrial-like [Uloborus diversus]|uniref:peptidyl-tRNA hydrolase 2, mitochondrial-like n=1 Tax=Uloborus diversus TaxID=327109 RepID=UPI00240999B2|nr:peptidyl-tRNA hydrolase 2, mitochondrial-like [Uloborus diversus]